MCEMAELLPHWSVSILIFLDFNECACCESLPRWQKHVSILIFLDFNISTTTERATIHHAFQSLFSWILTRQSKDSDANTKAVSILIFLDFNYTGANISNRRANRISILIFLDFNLLPEQGAIFVNNDFNPYFLGF